MDYKLIEKLRTLLPLGYLYLIIFGLLWNGVFFYMSDVNFPKYSSIMDILISPLAEVISPPLILATLVIMIIGFVLYYNFFSHKSWVRNSMLGKKYVKKNPDVTSFDLKVHINKQVYFAIVLMISAFFLGGGLGRGISTRDRIRNDNMKFQIRQ